MGDIGHKMTKILKILEIKDGVGPWIRLEDGKWYNLSITNMGDVYFDGEFVHNVNTKEIEENIYEEIDSRWEILDL